MALVFIDGFDHFDDPAYKYQSVPGTSNNLTFLTGRFGDYCVATTSSGPSNGFIRTLDSNYSEIYVGQAWQADNLSNSATTEYILRLRNATDGVAASVRYTSSGAVTLHLSDGVSVLASSSNGVLTSGRWHFIEVYYKPLNSGGELTVWVDNTQVVTYSGDVTPTTENVNAVQFMPNVANASQPVHYVDDVYITDTTGTTNNGRLGDCRVITMAPTADTTRNDFTPLTGSDNYAMVDEINTIDDDTTYVENGSAGATDRYTSAALSTNGFVSGATIHGMQITTCAKKSDTATRKFRASMVSNTTIKEDLTEHTLSTGYFCYVDPYDVDPSTSGAWTEAAIDAAKFGFKLTTIA